LFADIVFREVANCLLYARMNLLRVEQLGGLLASCSLGWVCEEHDLNAMMDMVGSYFLYA
jgi:hypothetical protein